MGSKIVSGILGLDDILDFSPFKFKHGINPRRMVRGRCQISKGHLLKHLSCSFCNYIMVQARECPSCEKNFCTPCLLEWEATESAKYYTTPCRCPVDHLKSINKLKTEYL